MATPSRSNSATSCTCSWPASLTATSWRRSFMPSMPGQLIKPRSVWWIEVVSCPPAYKILFRSRSAAAVFSGLCIASCGLTLCTLFGVSFQVWTNWQIFRRTPGSWPLVRFRLLQPHLEESRPLRRFSTAARVEVYPRARTGAGLRMRAKPSNASRLASSWSTTGRG